MGKPLIYTLLLLLIVSCKDLPHFHASLQTPSINGLTWCGRPFWSVELLDQAKEYSIYSFEFNLWYGEPLGTCDERYQPFLGRLHAYPDRIELLPDTIHHFDKNKITIFQYGLKPNTIMDSTYAKDRHLTAYTKYLGVVPFCGDTLYKFEWDALIYGWNERRYSTIFYISKTRGLVGMYDFCNEYGGQVLCALGHTPDEPELPRQPGGINCGAKRN